MVFRTFGLLLLLNFASAISAGEVSSLNFSSPAPHIFSSTANLLHQWPNTFFPNGHVMAACTVAAHTLLYHGRHDNDDPASPEWLAFDAEMAYGIMGSLPDSRLRTYRTLRSVGCLYFDGMSANLMAPGGVEAQMTFLYGDSDSVPKRRFGPRSPPRTGPNKGVNKSVNKGVNKGRPGGGSPLDDEYFRAKGLCHWIKERGLGGRGWGIEGVVRMNAAFELIWCDFDSPSLRLVSNLDITAPRLETEQVQRPDGLALGQQPLGVRRAVSDTPEGPHGPGMTDPSEPFRGVANWMWFTAAARRYGSSGTRGAAPGRGEARAKVDTCGLFTFYHPSLRDQTAARTEAEQKALNISANGTWRGPDEGASRPTALEQLMRRKRAHRINSVSKEDGVYMSALAEKALQAMAKDKKASCSGVDWQLTAQEISIFYADNLRALHELFADTPSCSDRRWLQSVRMLTHWFMLPFFEYPAGPYTHDSLRKDFSIDSPAAKDAILRCKTQYSVPEVLLNDSEQTLVWAIEETLGSICRVVIEIGLGVELEWLSHFNKNTAEKDFPISQSAQGWKMAMEELMAWLGWIDLWTGCEGPCAPNEICYIPMWPATNDGIWGRRPHREDNPIRHPPHRGPPGWETMDKHLWQPICVNSSSFANI